MMQHDPIQRLLEDWKSAKAARDPLAELCLLSTISLEDDRPRVRTLVLWEIHRTGLVVLTNDTSPKWRELHRNPAFELALLWTSLQKQYRIRGDAAELPELQMKTLWARKRRELKLLDHFYSRRHRQSEPVDRDEFLKAMHDLEIEFPSEDSTPVAPAARGLLLKPSEIDIWDGNANFPDRTLFRQENGSWSTMSLAP